MKVTRVSIFTNKINTLDIDCTQQQLDQYENGFGLIQEIFPNLSADEREFIKTGITPEEWEKTFN